MNTVSTMLATTAIFSDDGKKRYLLKKVWNKEKPRLAIIMLVPSEASGIELDNTTMLVLNNASRLGYGSVHILNLFSTLGDFNLKSAEDIDKENLSSVPKLSDAKTRKFIEGVGKLTNKIVMIVNAQKMLNDEEIKGIESMTEAEELIQL